MPVAALLPCRVCGRACGDGYCEQHRNQQRRQRDRDMGNSAQRGYDRRWRKARRAYLAAHPLCVDPHGLHGKRIVIAKVVDHVQPHRGNREKFWDRSNWQALCRRCHDRKTALETGWATGGHRRSARNTATPHSPHAAEATQEQE